MSKKLGAPLPSSSRDIKQDMIGLLTQSCHLSADKAVKQGRFLAKWIFSTPDMKLRALRWWAVKCAIIARNAPHFDGGAVLEHAGTILEFLEDDVDDEFDFEIDGAN